MTLHNHHTTRCLVPGTVSKALLRPLTLLILLISCTLATSAQRPAPLTKGTADTMGTTLSSRLGVSKVKARKIIKAFNYKSTEIRALMADTVQKLSVRQAKLRELMQERSEYLRMTLGPKLLDSLKAIGPGRRGQAGFGKEQRAGRMAAQGVAGTNLRPGAVRRDTINYHPSYKPHTKL
jgi:hypothetical protein